MAGCDEAKEEVKEVVDFLKDPQKFQKLGGRIPRGLLLVGPPGPNAMGCVVCVLSAAAVVDRSGRCCGEAAVVVAATRHSAEGVR